MRNKYHHLINQCINHNLYTKHKLKAKSKILYCDNALERDSKNSSVDWWNRSFFIAMGVILTATFWFTVYDVTAKHEVQSRMIIAFSVVRNIKKLLTNRGSEDLRFLDSQRFLLSLAVIAAHIFLKMTMGPIGNPIYFENGEFGMMKNGTIFISTFFVMSAFLLTVNFLQSMKASDVSLGNFGLALFNRYFRLTVPYIFMILLHGLDVYPKLLGPYFRYFVEKEKWGCRNYWYSKIMYTDNYNFRHNFVRSIFQAIYSKFLICFV